jgi:hypothetical protein
MRHTWRLLSSQLTATSLRLARFEHPVACGWFPGQEESWWGDNVTLPGNLIIRGIEGTSYTVFCVCYLSLGVLRALRNYLYLRCPSYKCMLYILYTVHMWICTVINPYFAYVAHFFVFERDV